MRTPTSWSVLRAAWRLSAGVLPSRLRPRWAGWLRCGVRHGGRRRSWEGRLPEGGGVAEERG
eukprot:1174538-Alexandrium_andersonii.AAC.1